MKNGLIVSDSGPIFSLAIVDKLQILNGLFDDIYIPKAVWDELKRDQSTTSFQKIANFFQGRIKEISGQNELIDIMDFGESESVILYGELQADFLLIDDKKARTIAEKFGVNCIGTLGILSIARKKGLVNELRPLFISFLKNKRYYSLDLLNSILLIHGEKAIQ